MEITSEVGRRSAEAERRVFAKIGWRLLPILNVAYILNYLDRNNVGFAALQMNREIGLTATQFGTGAGILFLGYCVFGLPANMVLYRLGARVWLSWIMVGWGIVSAATIFVTGAKSFYLLRFVLGAAEAGFFPGVAFYLGTWFPAEYRVRVVAWFMVAIPISAVVGGPVSGLLLQMNGFAGLSGWKWMFLLEGLPVVLIGLAMLRMLADRLEDAPWLTEAERHIVHERIASERREKHVTELLPALKDVRVLILSATQFGFLVGSYGIGIWLPQIMKAGKLSDLQIGFISSACYVAASAGMVGWAALVDKRGGKIVNLAISCFVSAVGFVAALYSGSFAVSLVWITLALVGINAARAIYWTIPPLFLTGRAAAGGLAFMNSIGTMAGFVGPFLVGWLTDRTGSYSAGLAAMGAFLLASTFLATSLKLFVTKD